MFNKFAALKLEEFKFDDDDFDVLSLILVRGDDDDEAMPVDDPGSLLPLVFSLIKLLIFDSTDSFLSSNDAKYLLSRKFA